MLCAKFQKAGLCDSWEKMRQKLFCDKFVCFKIILSSVKQEVDMRQIRNCVTCCSSPYWCSVPNIKKLACVVPEKNEKLFCNKFVYFKIILSSVKQEVDMRQIQNCVTQYNSPYWCSVPNISKLACVIPEKNETEIILVTNLSVSRLF